MTGFHLMSAPGLDPERDENIRELQRAIPSACLHEDHERIGPHILLNEILKCPSEDEWTVILQDDALLIPDWEMHLQPALTNSPRPVLSLGHFGRYGKELAARGLPYGSAVNAVWGYAWAFHDSVRAALTELSDFTLEVDIPSDDSLPIVLNKLTGQKTAITSRALFDHKAERKSLLGNSGKRRYPQSTIREPGPWWGSRGEGSVGTNSSPPGAVETVRLWKERYGDRIPG